VASIDPKLILVTDKLQAAVMVIPTDMLIVLLVAPAGATPNDHAMIAEAATTLLWTICTPVLTTLENTQPLRFLRTSTIRHFT
jgi:hypothetical protein